MPSYADEIQLRPAEPERDFEQLAAWFTKLEDEPSTLESLTKYYEQAQERVVQRVAERGGELLGFYWAVHSQTEAGRYYLSLYVAPEWRRRGIGGRLYAEVERALAERALRLLVVSVWDTCPECQAFAERRGFVVRNRQIAMELNLETWDDRAYTDVIARLQGEGFRFTHMEELGNTEEAQRKLYALNETASAQTMGSDGSLAWGTFENFQQSVCQAEWYRPDGQFVVIDTANGEWAAMSAITRFVGVDYAYNLFTGVDSRYRGRKLGQAVKTLALRYARQTLGVQRVRTHHNAKNEPMIAIDRKFGYELAPGTVSLGKEVG